MLQQLRRRRILIPVLTLLGGLVTSTLVSAVLWNIVDARDRLSFERNVDQAQDSIRDSLDTYTTLLRAGVGLFRANRFEVDREAFRSFAGSLRLQVDYPGIQGVGFTARVRSEERDAFVASLHRQGMTSFKIWPEYPRPEFHTIVYLEPSDARNAAAIGYDMFSEPTRRAAMERARDTGQPAISGRVELVQEIDEAKQAGFLLYVPLYRSDEMPDTVEERQEKLAGFMYTPFRADDLFSAIFQGGRNPGLELQVYDGAPVPQNLLHRSGPRQTGSEHNGAARYTETRNLDVAGRQWTIAYLSSRRAELVSARSLIPVFFAGGLIATFLVSGAFWAEVKARSAADRKSREAQLRAQELAVLNRAGASIAAGLDLDRIVQTVTDAGVELTGAQFGAFFYNVMNDKGESYTLYTLSGAPREAFARFPMPRATAVLQPTFLGQGIIRSDDILEDPRYGKGEIHHGMPEGHLPVRSYLAVPVTSRSGEVLGGLLFGHAEPGMFSEGHERLMVGVAAQAAIAIDNARLFQAAQCEIQERKRVELALRESEDRLHLALEAGRMAVWELDIATDTTTSTPELKHLLGFPPDQEVSQEEIRSGYLPGERERLLGHGRAALERGEQFIETEFQYRRPSGELRWFLLRADIISAFDGTPRTAIGVIVDVTERRRAEAGLRESEERLRLALDAGGLGSWELDIASDRRILSPRSAEIFGVQANELLEREAWQAVVHPDDRSLLTTAFQAALQGRVPYRTEFRILSKDGGVRWVSSQAIVHRDETGAPRRVVGIHQDITDRKRWEEHQQLLINELNHRVKNTLATVQSIASQTLRNAASTEQAREDLEGRLFALSRVHNVLTRESWEGASLHEIVEQAIEPYRRREDDRFQVAGDNARLPPQMALALALALQELATNAVKYGALSGAAGHVRVTWTISGPAADRRLMLRWEETGGPPVQPPTRRGFGTRLIERSLATELGGRLTLEFNPEGLRCVVDVPIVQLPQSGAGALANDVSLHA
jgi:PAS domain S-box-containing protein